MAPVIARAILWLIFTIILFDTIKEVNKLFGLNLNPYFAIILAVLNFLFAEYMFKKWKFNQEVERKKSTESKIEKILLFIGCIIVGSVILCVIFVWALGIYKNIVKNI